MEKVKCSNCGFESGTNLRYCSSCGYELPKIVFETKNKEMPKKSSDTRTKIFSTIVSLVFFAIAYFGVQFLFFNKPLIDNEMVAVANEINKTCPMMVDSETRLDNISVLPEKVFQYNYTLINIEKDNLDIKLLQEQMEPNIVNSVKSNPQMQYQRDNKWSINYKYSDKSGLHLMLISVTPDMYE